MDVSDIFAVPYVKSSLGILLLIVAFFGLMEYFRHSDRGRRVKKAIAKRFRKWLRSWTTDPVTNWINKVLNAIMQFIAYDCLTAAVVIIVIVVGFGVSLTFLQSLVAFMVAAFAANYFRGKFFS